MQCRAASEGGLLLRLDESRHIRESSQDVGCSGHKQRGGGDEGGGKVMGLGGNLR